MPQKYTKVTKRNDRFGIFYSHNKNQGTAVVFLIFRYDFTLMTRLLMKPGI